MSGRGSRGRQRIASEGREMTITALFTVWILQLARGVSPEGALARFCSTAGVDVWRAAISLAGNHDVFYPWMPSAENPADTPSRLFEPISEYYTCDEAEPPAERGVADLRSVGMWPTEGPYFLHLCSGLTRLGDLGYWVETLSAEMGMHINSLRIGLLADVCMDLLCPAHALRILDLCQSGRVVGVFCSPPCGTLSALRHKPLQKGHGPRPLRSRADPWKPLPYCTPSEIKSVNVSSSLFLICLGLMGEARARGAWVALGHLADPGCEPYPSFFNTAEVVVACKQLRLQYCEVDQCCYGANWRKPTGLLLPRGGEMLHQRCWHDGHASRAGLLRPGTADAATYPHDFSHALASIFVQRWLLTTSRGYSRPFKPLCAEVGEARDPWDGSRHVSWQWLQPSADFLASHIKTLHSGQLPHRFVQSQQ